MLVLIACAVRHSSNIYMQLSTCNMSNAARAPILGLKLTLIPYIVYVRNEGPGKTAHMRLLV